MVAKQSYILDLTTITLIGEESAVLAPIANNPPNRDHERPKHGSGYSSHKFASSVAARSQRVSLQEV